MKIEIICPLYNCSDYIEKLNNSLQSQVIDDVLYINYILTESTDNSEEILNKNHIQYKAIKKEVFSHSLTREKAAKESDADIICFISQDIVIEDNNWLQKLVGPIIRNEADATYSRQISKYQNIEQYTRAYNYGESSYIKTKKDIGKLGLNTFFFSDSASAINKKVFAGLNYYDGKDFPTNEDMYIAYKLIINGYRIKYCADSVVYHSHDFTLKEIYNRYKMFGCFFAQNPCFDSYSKNQSGFNMALFILKGIIKNRDLSSLIRFPFDMCSRFLGMKSGKKHEHCHS